MKTAILSTILLCTAAAEYTTFIRFYQQSSDYYTSPGTNYTHNNKIDYLKRKHFSASQHFLLNNVFLLDCGDYIRKYVARQLEIVNYESQLNRLIVKQYKKHKQYDCLAPLKIIIHKYLNYWKHLLQLCLFEDYQNHQQLYQSFILTSNYTFFNSSSLERAIKSFVVSKSCTSIDTNFKTEIQQIKQIITFVCIPDY